MPDLTEAHDSIKGTISLDHRRYELVCRVHLGCGRSRIPAEIGCLVEGGNTRSSVTLCWAIDENPFVVQGQERSKMS